MSSIVISGYYGFANAGDEAMLAAMIEAFTDLEPDVMITVISGNPEDTRRRHGVAAVYRLNYPKIMAAIASSDLVISGGGSLLQDVTSDRSLYYYLSIVFLAKQLGKPVMLYAQGIGPVQKPLARAVMRRIGNQVDLITVRDEGSREELVELGINKPPVYVTADPVLAMHPVDKQIGRTILRRYGVTGVRPVVGISIREWKEWPHYKTVLAQIADYVASAYEARVVFLPMQWPDDFQTAEKVVKQMKEPAVLLKEEFTTTEMLSLVGNMDLLIGIRLHALIFAAVMQVPLIGISYDPKIDRFLASLSAHHGGSLMTVTAEALQKKIDDLWPQIEQDAFVQSKKISELRDLAFSNVEKAFSLIQRK
ncbi:MAG: polysaccharide pyruvyl transferase CsaB [Sporomusaceae bacterium]|nr:polysaccharide pyruvyl transferase CsaB [Sporomusaceae bacterium]